MGLALGYHELMFELFHIISSLHSVPIILSKVSFLAFIEKWHD